jgi:hypothetical protein
MKSLIECFYIIFTLLEDGPSASISYILAKRAKDIHKAAKKYPHVAGDFYHGSAAHHMAAARVTSGHKRSQEVRAARVAHRLANRLGKKGPMLSKKIVDINKKAIPKGYGVG